MSTKSLNYGEKKRVRVRTRWPRHHAYPKKKVRVLGQAKVRSNICVARLVNIRSEVKVPLDINCGA